MVHLATEAASAPIGQAATEDASPVAMTARQTQIVETYRSGKSLRETANALGISMQRVHEVVLKFAPELIRAPYDTTQSVRSRPKTAA